MKDPESFRSSIHTGTVAAVLWFLRHPHNPWALQTSITSCAVILTFMSTVFLLGSFLEE